LQGKFDALPAVRELTDVWGELLTPVQKVNVDLPDNELDIGTIMCMPNGVVHGGPMHKNGVRMVLFFTATPIGKVPYDTDDQFTKGLLIGQLIANTFTYLDASEKAYMLRKLMDELKKEKGTIDSIGHYNLGIIANAIFPIKAAKERKAMIQAIADDETWNGLAFEQWDWHEEKGGKPWKYSPPILP
jgi:hypothetical protein